MAGVAGAACDLGDEVPSSVTGVEAAEEASAESGGARDGAVSAVAPTDDSSGKPPAQLPDLYDPALVPHIELTFDAAAMAVLSNPDLATKETWVHGSFKMGAITFADVGVRRKGSSTYRVLPQKASLKIKLNKFVKGQKVYGLEELTLNNMVSNSVYVAERLGFYTFRSLGLPAQRANTAHLTINGEDYGIYANVETPDENFLARVFGGKANTLYEGNWCGSWRPGCERGFEIDVADPNVPEGTRPDLTLLFDSVGAANDATLLDDLAPHLHTKLWLRHAAAEALIGHRDGYAFGIFGSPHNYFLAGDTDGKFALVPWSVDLSFWETPGMRDAATPHPDTVLARCKLSVACWDAYKAEVKSVASAFESLDLVSVAKVWHAQIDQLVYDDPKREASIRRYKEKKQLLYTWLAARPDIVRGQLGL
jgi:hypothetical protein